MAIPTAGEGPRTERTAADLTSLLVELSRALKGLDFYASDQPARRDVLDRAFLAWRVELERTGRLVLRREGDGFRVDGVDEAVASSRLARVVEAFREHDVRVVRIEPGLARREFHDFLEALARSARALSRRGGLAGALAEAGVEAVGLDAIAGSRTGDDPDETTQPLPPPVPGDAAAAARGRPPTANPSSASGGPAPRPASGPPRAATVPTEPDRPSASLGAALLGAPESGAPGGSADPFAGGDELEHAIDRDLEIGPGPLPEPGESPGFEDFTKPTLEEDPLRAPAVGAADESLRQLLVELDGMPDDAEYEEMGDAVVEEAARLSDAGHRDAAYRAVLALSDHAVGLGGRSGRQALAAQDRLERLCVGRRLESVMDRACDPEGGVAVRAAQVLLQLGGRAVPPLLDRLVREADESRAAQMRSIVIALGERAVPIVVAAIRSESPGRARVAVRLAGELQSTHLVPTLASLLSSGTPELRREAVRALARIANDKAFEALHAALESELPGVTETAAQCLGELGQRRSGRPLLARLERAVANGEIGVARAAIGALGALGTEEAVPKLVALLERRSLWRSARARELRLPALEALAALPGREARRAVERAARHRDSRVRERAARLLAAEEGEPARLRSDAR